MNIRKLLIALAVFYRGDWEQIYCALAQKRFLEDEEIDRLCDSVKAKTLTMLDAQYPEYLRKQYRPPFVLFYYGDISLIKNQEKILAVVGTRDPSEKGIEVTSNIVKDVAKRYIIVSGMAKGIDQTAHIAAMESGGKTIAVLGCGIDLYYPSECADIYKKMKREQLIISEYPNDIPPHQTHFPIRNRIIAQLGNGLLVTESKIQSGTMITVNYALLLNKEVMCVPSMDVNNSGCNLLLKEGAALIENGNDVVNAMQHFYYRKLNIFK